MQLSPKARTALLIAALAATLGAVYWASRLPQDEAAEPPAPVDRGRAQRAATADASGKAGEASRLDLARLQRSPGVEPSDDLFDPRDFAPPRPVVKRPIAQPGGVAGELSPAPPPPPPPVPFTYIGKLAEGAQTTVFLAAGDRNLVVQVGDVIDNTYKVEEVGASLVVLTYLPQNVKQTIPIGAP